MFSVMAKLLLNQQIKMSEGRLALMGVRDCFTPTITFVSMQKSLEKTGSQHLIYTSSKKAGYDWFKVMSGVYSGMKQFEAIKWGIDIVALSGWGIPQLEKIDLENKLSTFTIKNSTVAKLYGPSDFPVDHLFRGLVAGGVSFILKDDLDCLEKKCSANGDSLCQFLVGPKNKLNIPASRLGCDFGIQ